MASDQGIRASDRDRDTVVDTLRDAYVAGRLTLEEFNERTAAVYDGRTWGDLRELTADLPVQPVLGADIPGRVPAVPALTPSPRLPVPPPRTSPRPVHRGHASAFIPFVMFWFLVALVTHSSAALAVPIVIFALVILLAGIFRHR